MEAIESMVRDIMDDIVIRDDGVAFIDNYADWIMGLRKQPRRKASRVFVQLSVLARQYLDAGCKPVAVNLAVLARIGLPHPRPADAPVMSGNA
jgi:hypothetical protein